VRGPAYALLNKGDLILSVAGAVVEPHDLPAAIIGSDEPGSVVTLRVRRHISRSPMTSSQNASSQSARRCSAGMEGEIDGDADTEVVEVEVVRIESRELVDKRRLFELFTAIVTHIHEAESEGFEHALQTVDDAIALWTEMEHEAAERLRVWDERQRKWEERERLRLNAMASTAKVRAIQCQLENSLFDAVSLRRERCKTPSDMHTHTSVSRDQPQRRSSAEQEAGSQLRVRVEELEEELREALRSSRTVAFEMGAAHDDTTCCTTQLPVASPWKSHRLSVNKLKQARLVHTTVTLVEKVHIVKCQLDIQRSLHGTFSS